MKFDDIIALAKQGYKPADIKELLSLSTEPEPAQPEPEPAQPEPEQVQPEPERTQTGTDNSQEIEALRAQLAQTQAALKTAQQANTRQNLQDETKAQETINNINDWARSFM